jgi:carboxymethylenebutenolidase
MKIPIQTETGKTRDAYLAFPPDGSGPGVLVLHAWWGLTDFFQAFCDRLAAKGYVVMAPDLFGGQTAETVAEAADLVKALDFEIAAETVKAAVDTLADHPAIEGTALAVIGFSLGAAWSLLATAVFRPATIGAVVLFYGNEPGLTAEEYASTKAAFLGHFADEDEYESKEDATNTLAQMRQAGREAAFYFYPQTTHWFFESNRPNAFAPDAAQLAWERTLAFLHQHLPA